MVILMVEVPRLWAGLQGRDRLLLGTAAVWAANRSCRGREGEWRPGSRGGLSSAHLPPACTDSCAGNLSGALGFDVKPLQPCHFCIHPLPPTVSSITEKKWSLQ